MREVTPLTYLALRAYSQAMEKTAADAPSVPTPQPPETPWFPAASKYVGEGIQKLPTLKPFGEGGLVEQAQAGYKKHLPEYFKEFKDELSKMDVKPPHLEGITEAKNLPFTHKLTPAWRTASDLVTKHKQALTGAGMLGLGALGAWNVLKPIGRTLFGGDDDRKNINIYHGR